MLNLPGGLGLVATVGGSALGVVGILSIIGARKVKASDRIYELRFRALEENLPIIKIMDLSGFAMSFLGVVEDNKSIYFGEERLSLRVRPSFLTLAEPVIEDGIRTYYYMANWYFPSGFKGLQCMTQVVDTVKDKFPKLGFIKDELAILTSACVDDGADLLFNSEQLLKEYEQEDFLISNEMPVPETVEEPMLDENGEIILDEEGNPVLEEVDKLDDDGNVIYVKAEIMEKQDLVDELKRARAYMMSLNLRPGLIDMKRAMTFIPGKADGKNIDTLVKIEVAKKEAEMKQEDNLSRNMVIAIGMLAAMVIICYALYTLFPAVQDVLG
jgi:hypothetical protein